MSQHRSEAVLLRGDGAVVRILTNRELPEKFHDVICPMPELAEVEWYRKQWDPGLGDEIVDLQLHAQNRVFRGTNARGLQRRLIGQRFVSSHRRGKRMLFKFSGDNPESIGARENIWGWLGIHLGMTGKIHVEAPGFRPRKHDHLVLNQRARALVFTDARQFGRVHFHHGSGEPAWCNSNVPEIVSPDFDKKFVSRFLDRHGKAPIKAVLLMQSGFPGIGNWMADEILWRAKILPAKRTAKLTASGRAAILRSAKFVARKSLQTLGQDLSDPPKNWLIHQKWKRDGICPRHRTLLRHAIIGGRTTVWCPRCQR